LIANKFITRLSSVASFIMPSNRLLYYQLSVIQDNLTK